jgi:hypothetical protein
MVFSGMLIQINYHMGNHGHIDIATVIMGIPYRGWSVIHKTSIVVFSVLMILHVVFHWKWYQTVVSKNMVAKNIQVISLTVVFVLVALTGIIPWIIDLRGGEEFTRKAFIEIHDKLALVLLVYLVLHLVKRLKWFWNTIGKLRM